MTLAQLYAQIDAVWQRSASVTALIPGWAAEAANLIENDHTFMYMERSGVITLDPLATYPNQLDFPNDRVKAFHFAKLFSVDGVYQWDLVGVDAERVVGIGVGSPNGYWLDGVTYMYLDNKPAEAQKVMFKWDEYTDWPTSTAATPALLARHMAYLKAMILMLMGRDLTDPKRFQMYQSAMNAARDAALRADETLRYSMQNDERMQYVRPSN